MFELYGMFITLREDQGKEDYLINYLLIIIILLHVHIKT
jgi:hypothetical protein